MGMLSPFYRGGGVSMIQWVLLYVHVLAGFAYMLAHGGSAAVAFRLRREQNLAGRRALLDLSSSCYSAMFACLGALLLAGIIGGLAGAWWGKGWIWISMALLLGIFAGMSLMGSRFFHLWRKAVGQPYMENWQPQPARDPAGPEQLQALSRSPMPLLLTAIGLGGWALILALMLFRPF
jgi:hypothetical protein